MKHFFIRKTEKQEKTLSFLVSCPPHSRNPKPKSSSISNLQSFFLRASSATFAPLRLSSTFCPQFQSFSISNSNYRGRFSKTPRTSDECLPAPQLTIHTATSRQGSRRLACFVKKLIPWWFLLFPSPSIPSPPIHLHRTGIHLSTRHQQLPRLQAMRFCQTVECR